MNLEGMLVYRYQFLVLLATVNNSSAFQWRSRRWGGELNMQEFLLRGTPDNKMFAVYLQQISYITFNPYIYKMGLHIKVKWIGHKTHLNNISHVKSDNAYIL